MKRAVDVIVATSLLLVLSPVLAVLALMVWREDGGGPFFRQPRVGQDGKPFLIVKLRTMRSVPGPRITAAGDARITRIGGWLRRWKLDELPQLWNVVRGDMSLVGPRPEVPEYVASYPSAYRAVLSVRPGITGLAQIEALDEEEALRQAPDPEALYRDVILPRKLRIDLEYAQRASVALDLRILARTVARLVFRRATHAVLG